MALIYPPTENCLQKTLGAELLEGITASATLNSVTGLQNKKMLFVVDRVDSNGTETSSKREFITAEGTSGSTVVTLVRGLAGSTDQDHSVGAIVEFVSDVTQQQALIDYVEALNTTVSALPTADSTTTFTNKDLTSSTNDFPIYCQNKVVSIQVIAGGDSLATGDGQAYITIPLECNGMNLVGVHARVITAGTTGTTDIQIRNVTDSADMLSTKLTIDSGETGSDTAATPAVIDTTKDDVVTNDLLAIDIDAISTTAPKGLIVVLRFALP